MHREQEELSKLIEAIEDLPRMTAAAWRDAHPEIAQLVTLRNPLELPVCVSQTNRLQERLQLELQMRIAKCLIHPLAPWTPFAAL